MQQRGALGKIAKVTPHSGKTLSRRNFLRVSGAGLIGLALVGVAKPALGQDTGGTAVSATTLGIDPANSAAENRKNLVAALSRFSKNVVFPAGDYQVDNSGTDVIIDRFEGSLTMEPGARFVFTDEAGRGLVFQSGTGADFYGLSSAFQTRPSKRVNSQECILFLDCTDTSVKDTRIDGSAAAGLLFFRCIRPSVERAEIRNTMADGLHFANCQDAAANEIFTENTGDDGVAFLNYSIYTDYSGGQAKNLTVRRSRARGITVVGQRDVVIDGFAVDGTACPGIYCAYESSYDTRVPQNVRFANGTVTNAGRTPGQTGNRFGINYEGVRSVEFANIKVSNPATRGVSGRAPDGTVRMSGVEVQNVPESGFDLGAGTYYLNDLTANVTGRMGFAVVGSKLLNYGVLRAINTSKTDTLRRAFSFENNARVEGTTLRVVDDQTAATGYKVGAYGAQSGKLGTVYHVIANGNLKVENTSGLLYKTASDGIQHPADSTSPTPTPPAYTPPPPSRAPVSRRSRRRKSRRRRRLTLAPRRTSRGQKVRRGGVQRGRRLRGSFTKR